VVSGGDGANGGTGAERAAGAGVDDEAGFQRGRGWINRTF
jgi:hypothetical protein